MNENEIIVNGQYGGLYTIGNSDKIAHFDSKSKTITKQIPLPVNKWNSTFFANSLKLDKKNKFWLAAWDVFL